VAAQGEEGVQLFERLSQKPLDGYTHFCT